MKLYLKRAVHNRGFLIWMVLSIFLILLPILAPYVDPHDPIVPDYENSMLAYSKEYPLGTDALGRCILSRLIWGGRTSLLIVFWVVLIISILGIILGILAGIFGGWVDALITRMTDIVIALPSTVFVIAMVAVIGPGLKHTILAMSLVGWTEYCRVSRALVLSVKENRYMEMGRLGGMSRGQSIRKLILPNIVPYLLVNITQDIGSNLLVLSGLSMLGLSSQPPTSEWGFMLSEGRKYIQSAPWLIFYPGLMIVLHVTIFNLLGDSLRDILDPKHENQKNKWRKMKKWLRKDLPHCC